MSENHLIGNILDEHGEHHELGNRFESSVSTNKFMREKKAQEFVNMRNASRSAPPVQLVDDLPAQQQQGEDDEEEDDSYRSDPRYVAYYYNQRLLNPRLPPPVMNWKNVLPKPAPQEAIPQPSVKKQWVDVAKNPTNNNNNSSNNNAGGKGRGSSVVDRIQEDFPRTPSPVYTHQQAIHQKRTGASNGNSTSNGNQLSFQQQTKQQQQQQQQQVPQQVSLEIPQVRIQPQPTRGQQQQQQQHQVYGNRQAQAAASVAYQDPYQNEALISQMQTLSMHDRRYQEAYAKMAPSIIPPQQSQFMQQPNAQQLLALQQSVQEGMIPPYGFYAPNNMYPVFPQYSQIPVMMNYPAANMGIPKEQRKIPPQFIGAPGIIQTNHQMYQAQEEDTYAPQPQWEMGAQQASYTPQQQAPQKNTQNQNNRNRNQKQGKQQQQQQHQQEESFPRSKIMEELKSKSKKLDLKEIKGHVKELSRDQHGSRFIQTRLETASKPEKDMIFSEIYPEALELMTDVFGNYVIQKFFDFGSVAQKKALAEVLKGHVLSLTLQTYGCRVIQKALEVIDDDDKAIIAEELSGHIMRCVHDQNGNHVIQKCIEKIPARLVHFIVDAFVGNVQTQAVHAYGCRVIQRILEHCAEKQTKAILDEIFSSVTKLVKDQYGNYVVQHVLERGTQKHKSSICKALKGHFATLSLNKFASNVVERCYQYGTKKDKQEIIDEIIAKGQKDQSNAPIMTMMKDQYANYVVQKIIEPSDEQQRRSIIDMIKPHIILVRKLAYGKHIIACLEKYDKTINL